MIDYLDVAFGVYMKQLFSDYIVVMAKPDMTRAALARATNDKSVGIPGLGYWRTACPLNPNQKLNMPAARAGRGWNFAKDPNPDNQEPYNQLNTIAMNAQYTMTVWTKALSDLNAFERAYWFAQVYGPITFNIGPKDFTMATRRIPQVFAVGSDSYEIHLENHPLIPGTVQLTFGSTVAATDDGNGVLVFTGTYLNKFTGTVNYTNGHLVVSTHSLPSQVSTTVSFDAHYTTTNPFVCPFVQGDPSYMQETQKENAENLWWGMTKLIDVSCKWLRTNDVPQIKSIIVNYDEIVNGTPIELDSILINVDNPKGIQNPED